MRIRAQHIASLLVLLACFGVAETTSLRAPDAYFRGQSIVALLGQRSADSANVCPPSGSKTQQSKAALATTDQAQLTSVWTLRPPAAHSIARQNVSGSWL
ncbi:MAG: hypothetical protein ABI142_08805 [Bryocella sp.]